MSDTGPNAEIDLEDPAIAWNFGTRELTADEYARFADFNRRDFDRVHAAREADDAYAAWKAASPADAAEAEATYRAADQAARLAAARAAVPELRGEADPEPEAEIG